MKLIRLAVIATLPLLLSSCALLVGKDDGGESADKGPQSLQQLRETEQREVMQGAKARLALVRRQIDDGQFAEAEASLAPLASSSLYPDQVAELKAKISAARERHTVLRAREQIAVARRLAYKGDFDEADTILQSQDSAGPCREEILEVREFVNSRRLQATAKIANRQVTEIRRDIRRGDLTTADARLDALASSNAAPAQVAALRLELQAARDGAELSVGQQAAVNQVLGEVDQQLVLPKTYGKTIVISPNLDPIDMPVGRMEDLINKPVTIQLDNAGVQELVQVLSQMDGLNIIADDALEAQKSLTINVKQAPLKEVLSYIARNMGIAFHLGENIIWVTESTDEPGNGPKLETRIIQLRHGFAPALKPQGGGGGGGGEPEEDTELEDALDAFLADSPEGASYRVFRTRNVLVVKDTRENLRLVEELIKTFDKAPYQVLIEARFLTISQDDLRDVGSELTVDEDTLPVVGDANSQAQINGVLSGLGSLATWDTDDNGNRVASNPSDAAGVLSLGGTLGNRAYGILISAIEKRSSTKNLSAPRVTVINNRSARIRRGNTTLYYSELDTVASTSTSTTGAATSSAQTAFTGDPEELETGVTLDVKVNIGNDGQTVMLALLPEIIELTRWRSFNVVAGGSSSSNNNSSTSSSTDAVPGNIELPETSESSAETTVRVRSGQTVALGGLITSTVQQTVSKVPILGDIPLVGFFFRHTNEKNIPQHLLIFVTAKVIDEDGNFVRVLE